MNILERAPRYGRVGAAGGVANLDFVRYIRAEKDVDYNGGPLGTGIRNADMVIDTVGGRMLKPRARLEHQETPSAGSAIFLRESRLGRNKAIRPRRGKNAVSR